MKDRYDFSDHDPARLGYRGSFLCDGGTIRGAAGYQTLINVALREYLDGKAPRFEDTLRRIIREELKSSAA